MSAQAAAEAAEGSGDKWIPLESNPDVMNEYVQRLGMKGGPFSFVDVFATDEESLTFVPQPVISLLVLFPVTEVSEKADEQDVVRIEETGQKLSESLWYTKQTIGNACGTIGLLHAIFNNTDKVVLEKDSWLQRFYQKTIPMTPEDRAVALESENELETAHGESAAVGDTAPPSEGEECTLHFVALVAKDGDLYELDGRKPFPINHGPTTEESFLKDSVKIFTDKFIARDPEESQFSIVALAKSE